VKDIKLIEGVQRRATKLVDSVKDLHNDETLNILGLMRLDKRTDGSDLIETFKIMNGNYRVDKEMMVAEIGQGSRPCRATLYQKVDFFFIFLGPHSHPAVAIEVKFC